MSNENILTPKQVGAILNVHIYTVYGLLKTGKLKGFKLRTHWRIKREDLEALMNTKGVKVG